MDKRREGNEGFGDNLLPEAVADTDIDELKEIIRPAGFFSQKAGYLKAVTAWYAGYGYDVLTVQKQPLVKLRNELLSTKGVGQETADSIKAYFEGNLPKSAEVYNGFHDQIVINAKEHCRKKPVCDGCPLSETCGRCGA